MMTPKTFPNRLARIGVSTLAVLALLSAGQATGLAGLQPLSAALADSHSEGGSHEGGGQGPGGPGGPGGAGGGHDDGHDGGHDDGHEGGHEGGGQQGGGQGGQGQGGQGQGGKGQGQGGPGGGGKPPWAQEGIPAVELGRLNVSRAPAHVLDRAYAEALSSMTADMVGFYNLTIDQAVAKLSTEFKTMSIIDSPLQNLALFRDALDGTSILNDLEGFSNDTNTLMSIFLGVASDKNLPISTETALAVSIILGQPMSEAQAAAIAADAERIRQAVLLGHG